MGNNMYNGANKSADQRQAELCDAYNLRLYSLQTGLMRLKIMSVPKEVLDAVGCDNHTACCLMAQTIELGRVHYMDHYEFDKFHLMGFYQKLSSGQLFILSDDWDLIPRTFHLLCTIERTRMPHMKPATVQTMEKLISEASIAEFARFVCFQVMEEASASDTQHTLEAFT